MAKLAGQVEPTINTVKVSMGAGSTGVLIGPEAMPLVELAKGHAGSVTPTGAVDDPIMGANFHCFLMTDAMVRLIESGWGRMVTDGLRERDW